MVKRVSDKEIVKQAPLVLDPSSIDAVFAKDNPNVVFANVKNISLNGYSFFNGYGSGNLYGPAGTTTPSPSEAQANSTIVAPDVPSLADIEKIDFEEYVDSSGVAKYKVILKIRNSSREKTNVAAVDARIANDSGSVTYSIGTGTASAGTTGTTKSTYVSTVTWYKAESRWNPFSGTIVDAAAVTANAQYPADGNGVPADALTGSGSIRTFTAWRKTQQEAVAAATPKV